MSHHGRRIAALFVVAVFAAGCSASTTVADVSQTSPVESSSEPLATPAVASETAGGPVESVQGDAARVDVTATGIANPLPGYAGFDAGVGSAFVVDPSGLAIARHHVVGGADTVMTSAGPAEVLGWSECRDLAVIDIDAEGLPYAELAALFDDPTPGVRAQTPALTSSEASELIDRLGQGESIDTLGLNLLSVLGRGLWVAAVEPASPAGEIGVVAGDFVVEVDGSEVWEFANRGVYCDAVETKGIDGLIELRVAKSDTGQEFGAVVNNGESLERTGRQLPPAGYRSVQDESASFFFYAPEEWEIDGGPHTGNVGPGNPQVIASSDLATLGSSFDVGGLSLVRSDEWGAADIFGVLDALANTLGPQCHLGPSEQYDDGLYVGQINRYDGCGPNDAEIAFFAAAANTDDHLMYGFFQLLDESDRDVMAIVLDSLKPQR